MRHLMLFAVAALCVVMLDRNAARAADEESDEMKIRGTWQLVSTTRKGVETKVEAKGDDPSDNQPLSVTFEEHAWKAKIGPKGAPIEISGTYVLDPKQAPTLIDISVGGAGGSSDIFAIYKLEGDKLSIRIGDDNSQRPPDFEISADDCNTVVFRRAAE